MASHSINIVLSYSWRQVRQILHFVQVVLSEFGLVGLPQSGSSGLRPEMVGGRPREVLLLGADDDGLCQCPPRRLVHLSGQGPHRQQILIVEGPGYLGLLLLKVVNIVSFVRRFLFRERIGGILRVVVLFGDGVLEGLPGVVPLVEIVGLQDWNGRSFRVHCDILLLCGNRIGCTAFIYYSTNNFQFDYSNNNCIMHYHSHFEKENLPANRNAHYHGHYQKDAHYQKESPLLTKQNSLSSSVMSTYEIVEDDISKIAKSYVLDGGRLRLKSVKYGNGNEKSQKNRNLPPVQEVDAHQEQTISRKEMVKLEYLQKAGFLNEQEKRVLAQARKQRPVTSMPNQYQPTLDPYQESQYYKASQFSPQYPSINVIPANTNQTTHQPHYSYAYDQSYETEDQTEKRQTHGYYY